MGSRAEQASNVLKAPWGDTSSRLCYPSPRKRTCPASLAESVTHSRESSDITQLPQPLTSGNDWQSCNFGNDTTRWAPSVTCSHRVGRMGCSAVRILGQRFPDLTVARRDMCVLVNQIFIYRNSSNWCWLLVFHVSWKQVVMIMNFLIKFFIIDFTKWRIITMLCDVSGVKVLNHVQALLLCGWLLRLWSLMYLQVWVIFFFAQITLPFRRVICRISTNYTYFWKCWIW